jgi:hypothetical protein
MNIEMQWRIVNGFTKAQDGVARWMHALVFMWPNCWVLRALFLVHPPWRNNYRYNFNACTHHFYIEPL